MLVSDGDDRSERAVAAAFAEAAGRRTVQPHAVSRVPTAQLAGLEAVVAKQEIPHRVSFATSGPAQVRLDEAVHSFGVPTFALGPHGFVEHGLELD
jgi:hypothetical protein